MPTIVGPGRRVVAVNVRIAAGGSDRMKGLLGSPPLAPRDALILARAAQVHTFGMRVPIDVAFCDATGTVLHVVRDMRPGRITRWVRGSDIALEMAAGSLASIEPGDVLEIRDP